MATASGPPGPPPQHRPASARRLVQLGFRRVCVSSREDRGRYRGRRRAPTPPYTRYAVVVTGAFLGAGVVATGAGAALTGTTGDSGLTAASASGAVTTADLGARQAAADRANRAADRANPAAPDAVDANLWLLPLRNYTVAAPFGSHAAAVHPG